MVLSLICFLLGCSGEMLCMGFPLKFHIFVSALSSISSYSGGGCTCVCMDTYVDFQLI